MVKGGKDRHDPLVGEAIRELKTQLHELGGQGRVWVEQWNQRFRELGSLKDFVASRPDKFRLVPGQGKNFTVALADNSPSGGLGKSAGKGKWQGAGGWGGGGQAVQKGVQKGDGYDPVLASAITEIKDQLRQQGGEGKVMISDWNEAYGIELGPLKLFLLSRPDKFVVFQGQGKAFTVGLVSRDQVQQTPQKGAHKGRNTGKGPPAKLALPAGKGPPAKLALPAAPEDNYDPLIAEAVRELKDQLRLQGGTGKVWIDDWRKNFGELGSLRQFLEARPDKFIVNPGRGKDFDVSIAPSGKDSGRSAAGKGRGGGGAAAAAAAASAAAGKKRGLPEEPVVGSRKRGRAPEGSPAGGGGPAKRAKKDPLVGAAITEIKSQLRELGGEGRVWVDQWNQRFGELGNLRSFLGSRPDKFVLVDQRGGGGFTVALA